MDTPVLAAFLSCQGTTLTDTEKRLLSKANPLGITLFARNIANKTQLRSLVKQIKETIGRPDVLIAVDQEGGRVRRLCEPEFRSYSAQIDIGSLPLPKAVKEANLHAGLISNDLTDVGINVNFSPVLDIAYAETNESLRSRCFSNNPQTVSKLGQTMLQKYMASGIIPCIKHMPGHGLAVSDPHLGLPVIDVSWQRLQTEIIPFKDCNFSPLGMTAHILLPAIDTKAPLTQSAKGIQKLIREVIGFNGLLVSDAIDMKALKGSITEKALTAIRAGCDCICYCMGDSGELEALTDNCPKLSDAGLERLDKALQILHNKQQTSDINADVAQYDEIMGQITPYQETYDATEVLHKLQQRKE